MRKKFRILSLAITLAAKAVIDTAHSINFIDFLTTGPPSQINCFYGVRRGCCLCIYTLKTIFH
ncbi:MAG TPA: hypothetical protein DCK76_12220 [Desulfotomaculum sp.]|nr:hypothetical protein [Desulfotomaculum sp.]HBY04922.1 hypothetical protein [Desulfotomaculum sp.]